MVRTLQGELRAAREATYERKTKEMLEKIKAGREKGEPLPTDDDETKVRIGSHDRLLPRRDPHIDCRVRFALMWQYGSC
jgi:hypothetical protein